MKSIFNRAVILILCAFGFVALKEDGILGLLAIGGVYLAYHFVFFGFKKPTF